MSHIVDKSWLEELKKRVEFQETSRLKMIEIRENVLDNEKELRSLDSTLKKTTSFMKKIKLLSAATVPQLIEELSKLNLSKFVEEMASGIIETKLKLSDIPKVTELCLAISAKYSNFSEQMAGEFKKVLPVKKSDKVANVAKLRVDIIFLAELCLCGVFNEKEGLQVLGAVLSYLIQTDKTEFVNVGLLATVSRSVGWQIANIVPIPSGDDVQTVQIKTDDLPVSKALSDEQKKSIRELFKSYYDALYAKTEKTCSARNKAMKRVKRQERSRGDAADDEKTKFNELQIELDSLRKLASEIATAVGIKMKPLKEEASDDEEDEAANLEMGRQLAEGAIKLWSDDESKAFYEDLIDLRQMVPKDLYKDSEQRTLSKAKMAERIEDIDVENVNETGAVDGKRNSMQRVDSEKETSPEDTYYQQFLKEASTDTTEERGVNKWQKFVLDLDHLVSKYSTDKAAEYFVSNLNNKGCRKRLVKLMVDPPPTRIDVVPFYARLIATLENVMPDLTTEIVTQLLDKFRGFLQQKPSSSPSGSVKVESKMVIVMMIAELMKFGVISRAEGLSCLRQLVYDLRGHSVEMTATFMESGGLYLYRHTESHAKMKRLLEVVKAKRERMKDQRQAMLIDNAYFTCLPPEDSKEERLRLKLDEEDTPMKRFIRHIVLDINNDNVDVFLKCFRRLDWSDPEISDYAIRYLSSTWLLPIENLEYVASAISGLCNLSHLKWIGNAVVDSTIETIRISLENPGSFNQWAHSAAVYLAELYSYALCDEDLILQVLYQIISYPEPENSWKDLHRIRMVCAVVEIVREFFEKHIMKMRYFLSYFSRYYYTKKEAWDRETASPHSGSSPDTSDNEAVPDVKTTFPYEVEVAYIEMCRHFRKNRSSHFRWPKNLKDAQENVNKIEKKFRGELKGIAGDHSENEDDNLVVGQKDLNVIEEDDEDDFDENRDSDAEIDDDDSEEERVVYAVSNAVTKEEDDDFQRELDRMLGEGFRQSTTAPVTAQYDVTLPAAAKNRFNRNIKFAEDTKVGATSSRSRDFNDDDDDEPSTSNMAASGRQKQSRVTLMVRGKANKPSLKTVNIDDNELQKRWKEEKAREEQERADMKRLTLGQHRRIEMEEEKALLAQLNSRKSNAKRNPQRPQFPKPHLEGEW